MTYEEKLEKIVTKLKDERDLTRKGHKTRVTFTDTSFTKISIRETCKILLQLKDDEGIVTVIDALQPIETVPTEQIINPSDNDDYEGVEEITVEFGEEFDNWYKNYLIRQKSSLVEMNYLNLLRVLDTLLSIREKIQLNQSATVVIPLLPQRIRFRELFLADDIGQRDEFIEGRWDSLGYLKKENIIDDFRLIDRMMHRWDNEVEVIINPSPFYNFIEKVKAEVSKRLEKNEQEKEEQPTQDSEPMSKVSYDSKKGVLNIESKKVQLKKDSFRAKLIELLLKDDSSRKKEWLWDEVIEAIEDTNSNEATKENKSKFYPACDGLAKHIASKTGINDLLIFTKSTVQINSKYI